MNSWILYGIGCRLNHIALLSIKIRLLSDKSVEELGLQRFMFSWNHTWTWSHVLEKNYDMLMGLHPVDIRSG
jgi:hypothetical protein